MKGMPAMKATRTTTFFPPLKRTRPLSSSSWRGKRVLVVGAARQGTALARFFARRGAHVVLNDRRPLEDLVRAREALQGLDITWVTGGHPVDLVDDVDAVAVSGGVPLDLPMLQAARQRGLPLYTDAQLFLEHAPCPVVAITGSSGKSTTTTLVGRMAQAAASAYRRVWVLGNIGPPLLDYLDDLAAGDLAVVELSSFQLELVRVSPEVAAVLNITPNHLDRHGTMQAYIEAKAQAVLHQRPEDWAVLGFEDEHAWALRARATGRVAAFGLVPPPEGLPAAFWEGGRLVLRDEQGSHHPLLDRGDVALPGEHNLRNVAAAALLAVLAGLSAEHVRAGVQGFTGLPHRLERVLEQDGVAWYNDSIATTPHRAMAAMQALAPRPIILLAGGKDKDLPWDEWAGAVRQYVEHLVVFGSAAEKILQALDRTPGERPRSIYRVQGLRQAVERAAQLAQPGMVVLLSPGATSFDEFPNFEVRGQRFREWVHHVVKAGGRA